MSWCETTFVKIYFATSTSDNLLYFVNYYTKSLDKPEDCGYNISFQHI